MGKRPHYTFFCDDCRITTHVWCRVHRRNSCSCGAEIMQFRYCSRCHHMEPTTSFIESSSICQRCFQRVKNANNPGERSDLQTHVLQRRDGTVTFVWKPKPYVAKRVSKSKGYRELQMHRKAAAVSSSVIPLYDYDVDANYVTLILPLIERMRFNECCTRRRTRPYLRQLCHVLRDLHENGIVHADIKPDNILVSRRTGKLFVADFGLSTHVGSSTRTQFAARNPLAPSPGPGTAGYRAPEILGNLVRPNSASDMWSVGIILYGLLKGSAVVTKTIVDEVQFVCSIIGSSNWASLTAHAQVWNNMQQVNHCEQPQTVQQWRKLCAGKGSTEALDLLRRLLLLDPATRISAAECLQHPFLWECKQN